MADSKKTLLSGVKPTGSPHIGNYLGAMKQFVELQNDYNSSIFIADYHALTTLQDPQKLEEYTTSVALDYLALGLDPLKVILYKQSDVPEHTELAWIFNCITTVPYLMRAHAFKDSQAKNKEISVGTFDYPMLMAADILMYDADVVPVGKDQKQHIEIARDTAGKFNRIFGDTFTVPEALILEDAAIVPGIDGQKMSKSYNNTIPLFGETDELKRAIMSIVTDSKGVDDKKDSEKDNVFALHKFFSESELPELEKRYKEGNIGYKESKEILFKNIEAFVSPLREKRNELSKDKSMVYDVLKKGGEQARKIAQEKMADVRKKIGVTLISK
ncbi:tryptophan--tRNA ligase [Patescibacteria group bacterium]|nr:tryptophan--tRNA ligase [Patescibacteria group bacterium]